MVVKKGRFWPEICVILTGCVVIAAFDFALQRRRWGGWVDVSPVEIKGEAVGCFAGGQVVAALPAYF